MSLPTGYPFYGQLIGVLVFDGTSPRIPGDPGCATTFSHPVCYEVVRGGFQDLVEGSEAIKAELLQAGGRLKAKGVRAILGDCGLMSLYQGLVGERLGIPFLGSSLCQIPMIWQMIGRAGEIGVITGHAGLLRDRHLRQSGWSGEIGLSIQGMEAQPHFARTVIEGDPGLDPAQMRADLLRAGRMLARRSPSLRAVVLECSNLCSYARELRDALGLPVFDILSAARLLEYAVNPPGYHL